MVITPRMQRLLDAAVQVVAAEGLRGLTHRAVDRRAGLPEGSCSAYLRTRLALLTALTEYVSSRFAADVRELTDCIGDHVEDDAHQGEYAVAETVRMFLGWVEHPELLQTRLELNLEGQRQPELAAASAVWADELLRIVERVMIRKGHQHPEERAATMIASMDGVLLRALREDPADRRPFLQRSLDLLIPALVVDAPR